MRLRGHAFVAWGPTLTTILLVVSGCSLLRGPGGVAPSSGSGATASPEDAGRETTSPAQAIPDPLNPTTHQVGDEVRIPDGRIIYLGLSRAGDQIVARFELLDGNLPADATLIPPGGGRLELTRDGSSLESEPFGDAAQPPAAGAVITLVAGNALVPFEAGPLD